MRKILTVESVTRTGKTINLSTRDLQSGNLLDFSWLYDDIEYSSFIKLLNNEGFEIKNVTQIIGMSFATSGDKEGVFPLKLLRLKGVPTPIFQDSKTEPTKFWGPLDIIGTDDLKAIGLGCDYAWRTPDNKLCLCERKEIHDLVASIADGRLRRELEDMRRVNVDYGFLLIEGWMGWDKGRIVTHKIKNAAMKYQLPRNYAQVWEALATFQIYYPEVIVWLSPGINITPYCLRDMYNWSKKEVHTSMEKKIVDLAAPEARTSQEVFLTAIPGIGIEAARSLVEKYETIYNIVTTTKEDLAATPIGKKQKKLGVKAGRMLEFFNAKPIKIEIAIKDDE